MKKLVLILVMMVIGCMGFAEEPVEQQKQEVAPPSVEKPEAGCDEASKVPDTNRAYKNTAGPDYYHDPAPAAATKPK